MEDIIEVKVVRSDAGELAWSIIPGALKVGNAHQHQNLQRNKEERLGKSLWICPEEGQESCVFIFSHQD